MADYYRTRGFVISKKDFREADQLFNVYTKDFGKVEILGRAIRKISSKLRSSINTFYFSEIEFIQGRHYKTLTDALALEKFKSARNDLEKVKVGFKILSSLDSCIHCEEKDEKIFNLLAETFGKLNSQCSAIQILYHYFLWNLFSILGYRIDLHNCSLCHKKLTPVNLSYSFEKGGIICSACPKEADNVSPEAVKILRFFDKKDWDTISRIKITEEYGKSLDLFLESYFFNIKSCCFSS